MGKKSQKQTTNTKSNAIGRTFYDPTVTNASNQAIDRGLSALNRDYTPYDGNRIAALSGNESRGIELAGQGFDESRQYMRRGALGFNDAFQKGYLQPYMDNLANPIIEDLNRDHERRRQSLDSTAAIRGAFGGSRAAIENSVLDQNYLDDVRRTRQDAFGQAIGVFNRDQDRQLQAGQGLANLTQAEIQNLMQTGGVDRVLRQAQSDFDYGQFLENRDWDVNNLTPLLQVLSSVPKNVTQTQSSSSQSTTKTEAKGDAFGQILGAATTAIGAYFTGGASLALGAGKQAAGGIVGGALSTINPFGTPSDVSSTTKRGALGDY